MAGYTFQYTGMTLEEVWNFYAEKCGLEERFKDAGLDGPSAYGVFLATRGDDDQQARLRREAVATVREFLRGFRTD